MIRKITVIPYKTNDDYMTIKRAAEHLGVTMNTLRNWDKAKKIKTYRHPISNYRLYKLKDLNRLLEKISKGE